MVKDDGFISPITMVYGTYNYIEFMVPITTVFMEFRNHLRTGGPHYKWWMGIVLNSHWLMKKQVIDGNHGTMIKM